MKRAFLFLVRWGIGLLFLYAGAVKIADPSGFARAVEAYRILPSGLIPPFPISSPGSRSWWGQPSSAASSSEGQPFSLLPFFCFSP